MTDLDSNKQKVRGHDNTAVQAGGDLSIYQDNSIGKIALNVAAGSTIILISSEETARRAVSTIEKLYDLGVSEEDEEVIKNDPYLQSDIAEGIKNAIKREDLKDIIAQLMHKRIKDGSGGLKKIYYSDAIQVVASLDYNLVNLLSTLFMFRRLSWKVEVIKDKLDEWYMEFFFPFKFSVDLPRIEHLISKGCASLGWYNYKDTLNDWLERRMGLRLSKNSKYYQEFSDIYESIYNLKITPIGETVGINNCRMRGLDISDLDTLDKR